MGYWAHILFGPPASGKGTAARGALEILPKLEYISTGDLFRAAKKDDHPLKAQMLELDKAGSMYPDEWADPLVKDGLSRFSDSSDVLFDGYPRNMSQAAFLDSVTDVVAVYNFTNIPDSVLEQRRQKRVAQRAAHGLPPRLEDEYDAFWGRRIPEFRDITYKVLDHYVATGVPIICIDALPDEKSVSAQLAQYIKHNMMR